METFLNSIASLLQNIVECRICRDNVVIAWKTTTVYFDIKNSPQIISELIAYTLGY